MNPYEILLLLDPDLPDERQAEIVARVRELVERGGGSWLSQEPWGRRKLAYEIDHRSEGAYHLLAFDASAATLEEISRVLKIADEVMRFLAVRRVESKRLESKRADDRAPAYAGTNVRSHDEEE